MSGEILELTAAAAALLALERSPELAVERLTPQILETFALEERALYDPLLELEVAQERVEGRDLSAGGTLYDYSTDEVVGEAALTWPLTTGTTLQLTSGAEVVDVSFDGQLLLGSWVGATLNQSLLRGVSRKANVARVRAAQLEADASAFEVRFLAETIAALAEQTYWDCLGTQRQVELHEGSIALAETFVAEIRDRVELGLVGHGQVVAATAEIALRRQNLVDAQAARDTAQALLRSYLDVSADAPIQFTEPFEAGEPGPAEVATHIASALRGRPDLNQARTLEQRGEIEVQRTKHGLLPRLDAFVTYDRWGYGPTPYDAWHSLDEDHFQARAGVRIEWFLARRDDRADHRRERAAHTQATEAVRNLEHLVEIEVRAAHIEASRARVKLAAVAETVALDADKLRIERERFEEGLASSFQVARAQRDLLARQIDQAEALAEYRKGLTELYRVDGSLLERRGIVVEP